MKPSMIDYYKPKGKGLTIALCVLFLSVVAIVYAVCASDIAVHVQGAYDIDIKTGNGSQPVIIQQHIQEANFGA
jgi:hypothetical protein